MTDTTTQPGAAQEIDILTAYLDRIAVFAAGSFCWTNLAGFALLHA